MKAKLINVTKDEEYVNYQLGPVVMAIVAGVVFAVGFLLGSWIF